MPWGKVDGGALEGAAGFEMMIPVNGWGSSVILGGFDFPNWVPAILAIVLALWGWMDRRIGRRPAAYLLAALGIGQSGLALVQFRGTIEAGLVVVAAAFVSLPIILAVKALRFRRNVPR